jgi:Protein of unknown function (DUF3460)
MGRVVTDYVSDHTRWINEQLAKNPEWVEDQKAGRAIWWDRPQTEEAKRAAAEAQVAQKPYPYDNAF